MSGGRLSGGRLIRLAEAARRFRTLVSSVVLLIVLAVVFLVLPEKQPAPNPVRTIRVLAYSSFLATWGPGPTLKRMFEHDWRSRAKGENISIEYLQSEDAGLLLPKLAVFPADLVIGFDQFTRSQAMAERSWKQHGIAAGLRFSDDTFFAFDWAPIGFVYRHGEIDPPRSLDDLLDIRFRGSIALQDPRSSSPGFQFLAWVVEEKGEAGAREFLKKLKPNVHSVSGSWSQSYGIFTRGMSRLVLSYATSPLYHRYTEKDERYRFAPFSTAHPVQVEYAAIPDNCTDCQLAQEFAKFLISPPAQQVIMNKNWMLPINVSAAEGTAFGEILDAIGLEEVGVDEIHSLKIRDPMKRSSRPLRNAVLSLWEELKF